jgi:hypothetical protein
MIAKLAALLAAPHARLALGLIAAVVLVHVRVPLMGGHTVPVAVVFLTAELAVCAALARLIVRQLKATMVWRPM